MTHNIFQEIDEDLERQKMEDLWRRYGPYIIAAAVIAVIATAAMTGWDSWRAAREQKATDGLIAILDTPGSDQSKQIAALENFATQYHGETQSAFAQLQAAADAVDAGDTAKAVSIYDALAADTKADPAFRQLADLLAVQAQMDSGDPVTLQKRLQPLLADNAPWRATAMQYDAFLALRAGDKPKAKQLFSELAQDGTVPMSLRTRAGDMLRFIGD